MNYVKRALENKNLDIVTDVVYDSTIVGAGILLPAFIMLVA